MNSRKAILSVVTATLVFLTRVTCAEETNSVLTALSSTLLTGYVDTSASWWVGAQSLDRPANDAFTNAEPVAAAQVSLPTNMIAATLEPFETPKQNQVGSIWYRWQINTSGTARISKSELIQTPQPSATSYTPALSPESIFYEWGGIVWTGAGISSHQDIGNIIVFGNLWWATIAAYRGDLDSQLILVTNGNYLEFNATAGETISICVELYRTISGFPGASEDTSLLPKNLYFDVTPPPANDHFASDLSVSESSEGAFAGYLLGATREAAEPDLGPDYAGGSVWFHFKAATYGTVQIGGPRTGVPIAVFNGPDLASLKLVARTTSGLLTFFGHENEIYHIALYGGSAPAASFYVPFAAPQYRLYETNVDFLFPTNLFPHFYGVRGATMLLYAKTATGWQPVEIEPIVNQSADLLIRPTSIDGQLRVTTIDENLPSPHVEMRRVRDMLVPHIIGIPGQTCAVSYSTDLINWSTPQIFTLTSTPRTLAAISSGAPSHFFRVSQSVPQPTTPQIAVGTATPTVPDAQSTAASGALVQFSNRPPGSLPPPPMPRF